MITLKDIESLLAAGAPVYMATIIETHGSTYQKIGAKKLFNAKGQSYGMISGGCLEREITSVFENSDKPTMIKSYQSTTENDRLFGTQLGCSGSFKVLFETIDPALSARQIEHNFCGHSEHSGMNRVFIDQESEFFGARCAINKNGQFIYKYNWPDHFDFAENHGSAKLFTQPWRAKNRIVIFGAGEDLVPLYSILNTMGWDIRIFDYREELVAQRRELGWPIHQLGKIDDFLTDGVYLILMSHNYTMDLEILSKTERADIPYIGLLGPKARGESLIGDAEKIYSSKVNREVIHSPIGLTKMGRGPQAIALSIAAQLQMELEK